MVTVFTSFSNIDKYLICFLVEVGWQKKGGLYSADNISVYGTDFKILEQSSFILLWFTYKLNDRNKLWDRTVS